MGPLLFAYNATTRLMSQFVAFTASVVGLTQRVEQYFIAQSRHSPDAVKVSQHLSNTTGGQSVVTSDHVCYACYRAHCTIFKSLKAHQGTDGALQQFIKEWVSTCNNDNTDKLTMAIL